ncbi:MAG TPA: hypothetical protein VG942_08645 [Hyphomonadaceae bacterium]|nr:hypothetical protein [Hyphomonadaceae bacterium]
MQLRVFAAVGMTLAFVVQHILDVLRVIWLPILLQVIAYPPLMPGFLSAWATVGTDPDAAMSHLAPVIAPALLFIVIFVGATVMMSCGLTRLILRGEKPALPFLMRWGMEEWRVLGAWLMTVAIFLALEIGFIVVGRIIASIMALGPGPGVILGFVSLIVVACLAVWIGIRLSLLVPATIAMGRIAPRTSWETSEGNFWNMVGFWLIFAGTALVVQLVSLGFLTPPGYFEAIGSGIGSQEEMRAAMRKAAEIMAKSYDLSDSGNLTRWLTGYALSTLGVTITTIAGAVAWRQLTDKS